MLVRYQAPRAPPRARVSDWSFENIAGSVAPPPCPSLEESTTEKGQQALEARRRWGERTQTTFCVLALFGILILTVGSTITLYNIHNGVNHLAAELTDPASFLLNKSLAMVTDTASTLDNVEKISDETVDPVISMLNSTTNMLARMERLMAHPTLQLSMLDTEEAGA